MKTLYPKGNIFSHFKEKNKYSTSEFLRSGNVVTFLHMSALIKRPAEPNLFGRENQGKHSNITSSMSISMSQLDFHRQWRLCISEENSHDPTLPHYVIELHLLLLLLVAG